MNVTRPEPSVMMIASPVVEACGTHTFPRLTIRRHAVSLSDRNASCCGFGRLPRRGSETSGPFLLPCRKPDGARRAKVGYLSLETPSGRLLFKLLGDDGVRLEWRDAARLGGTEVCRWGRPAPGRPERSQALGDHVERGRFAGGDGAFGAVTLTSASWAALAALVEPGKRRRSVASLAGSRYGHGGRDRVERRLARRGIRQEDERDSRAEQCRAAALLQGLSGDSKSGDGEQEPRSRAHGEASAH